MTELTLHSFEAGRRGKPDELDSQLANIIVREAMRIDPHMRADMRVSGQRDHELDSPIIHIGGELSANVLHHPDFLARVTKALQTHIQQIEQTVVSADQFVRSIKPQSVALESNSSAAKAGDTGTCIAVAYAETINHLPIERRLAVEIRDRIDALYQSKQSIGPCSGADLRADGKIQVLALYDGVRCVQIPQISVAVEHTPAVSLADVQTGMTMLVQDILKQLSAEYHPEIIVNGAGDWHVGGWKTDAGTREAKPYRDGFSSYGHCEDSFSGEDPSKPSATGTLIARQIAVWVVKQQLASFAHVSLVYQIGYVEPLLYVTTQGTGTVSQDELHRRIHEAFPALDLHTRTTKRNLRSPEHYEALIQASDYFQDEKFAWNR